MCECGALSSIIPIECTLSWEVPKHWSLEEAATVPVAYSTVLLAFKTVSKTEKIKKLIK